MACDQPGNRRAGLDDPPPPRVPEPLFPVLRRLTGLDVQQARAWLLAWLLDRLGQRVQTPPPPGFRIQRRVGDGWQPVVGPFHREWIAVQIAREFASLNTRRRYRVVGPGFEQEITDWAPADPKAGSLLEEADDPR